MASHHVTRKFAMLIAILAALFSLRVIGHIVVKFTGGLSWPPDEEDWLSGAVPYSITDRTIVLETSPTVANQSVYHGSRYASSLILPLNPR